MNRRHRTLWNHALHSFVAVPETAPARGSRSTGGTCADAARGGAGGYMLAGLHALAAAAALACSAAVQAAPSGGVVSAGSGSISSAGGTTTITQASPRLAINWQSFNTSAGETVNFVQPGSSAVALNRVLGTEGTQFLGRLNANGQVFVINPNGVLFGKTAQVNVGGLVASTLALSDADFMAGRLRFGSAGQANGSVSNEGQITAADGGYAALLGGQVNNSGTISARLGSVALAAGNAITLDFAGDGLLSVAVDQGRLNALAGNSGHIIADGGNALLTAKSAGDLISTAVNNTGVIQARTLQNKAGVIKLLGGMDAATGGAVSVSGTLDASAPDGGNGGFIEASAQNVRVLAGTRVTTRAPQGKTGEFLIDPTDFTITNGADPSTTSSIGSVTLQGILATSNFTAVTTNGAGGTGALFVDGPVTWTSTSSLRLQSLFGAGTIQINQPISYANGSLKLEALSSITSSAAVTGKNFELLSGNWQQLGFSLPTFSATDFRITGGSFVRALGGNGTGATPYRLTDVYGLQGMGSAGQLGNFFNLANNINASGTAAWNAGLGWKPVGDSANPFVGRLNGGNFTVSGLTIARPTTDDVGLFGILAGAATVQNLNLASVSMDGSSFVGGLAGRGGTSTTVIQQVSVSGSVSGNQGVGGLVGRIDGSVERGINTASVTSRGSFAGGIAGVVAGSVSSSYNNAVVTGQGLVGGITGSVSLNSSLETSFNTGEVRGSAGLSGIGGLAGQALGVVRNAYSTGAVVGGAASRVGGAIGSLSSASTVSRVYSTGAVSGASNVGGLVGAAVGVTLTDSFWDTTTSGQSTSAAGIGKTSAELKTLSTFTGAGWTNIDDAGSTGNTWRIYGGNTTPLLRSFMTPLTVTPAYNGTGAPLANIGSASVPGGANPSLVLVSPTKNALTLSSTAAGNYTATIDPAGIYSTQLGYDLTIGPRTIATPDSLSGNVRLGNGVSWTNGTLVINTTGRISASGAIAGGAGSIFDLKSGNWQQVSSTLPGFAVNDFRLSGGTFLRAVSGAGNPGNPTLLVDVYGLQGMASAGQLGNSFQLANNIDASGTTAWNAGLGWKPVGLFTPPNRFTGSLAGGGYTVSGLTIARSTETNVGLFGAVGGAGRVADLTLSGVSITGGGSTGGVAGVVTNATGSIDGVKVSGSVTGQNNVGGLVGILAGTLSHGTNEATVRGSGNVGGIVGQTQPSSAGVLESINSGSVVGNSNVGGIIGSHTSGVLEKSFNTGDVRVNLSSGGGLVGFQSATVQDAYTTGAVVGGTANGVGGAVGSLVGATLQRTYSTGAVSSTGGAVGGLVGGAVGGTVTASFWDTSSSGRATSGGGTGKTTAELKTLSTFTGWDIDDAGGTGKIWRIYGGNTTPLLRSFLSPLTVTPAFDGSGAALTNIGDYALPPGANPGLVRGSVTVNRLTLLGSLAGTYGAAIDPTGLFSTQLGYDISAGTRSIATPGSLPGSITLPNGVAWTNGTLVINTNGSVIEAGAIDGGAGSIFELRAGNWQQLNGTLPGFTVRDFRISGSSFLRALGGDGSNATPYRIADVYGLQGMGSSSTLLGSSFQLTNNINAGGTVDWNGGLGWRPVGTEVSPFTGSLDGRGLSVSNLSIARPSETAVGLIGFMSGTSRVADLRLSSVSVLGLNDVGAAVGRVAAGTVERVRVSGSVSGANVVGGVVGIMAGGGLSGGVNEATVTATGNFAGGITGIVRGQVSTSTNSGVVTGGGAVGGIAGSVEGMLETSFNTGEVRGNGGAGNLYIGGLTGQVPGAGTVRDAYSTGAVMGGTAFAVGGAIGLVETATGVVDRVYSTGAVSGGSGVGGLIGAVGLGAAPAITNSFWDTTSSGQATSARGVGKTTAELKTLSTFTNAGWTNIDDAAGTGKTWRIYSGNTTPLLRSFFTGPLDLSSSSQTRTYTGSTITVNASLPPGGLVQGSGPSGRNVGSYASGYFSTQFGYDITQPTLTINPAVISLLGQRAYDRSTTIDAAVVTPLGVIPGETLSVSGSGSVADKNVGNGKPLSLGTLALGNGTGGGLASNYTLVGGSHLANITPRVLAITSATALDKTYDGTTAASLNTSNASAFGVLPGDTVTVSVGSVSFVDKNAGTAKPVTASGISLSGPDAGNYSAPANAVVALATILPKPAQALGLTVPDKTYDGTIFSTVNTDGFRLGGLVPGDTVFLSSAASRFQDKNAGNAKLVTFSNVVLVGADAGNYSLLPVASTTASILPRSLTISGLVANSKPYDGNTSASFTTRGVSLGGVLGGDNVALGLLSGNFATATVGYGKAVNLTAVPLVGTDAGNYRVLQWPLGLKANITTSALCLRERLKCLGQ